MTWKKSSKCEANNCVEVSLGDRVGVRDSAGRVMEVEREAWRRFVAAVPEAPKDPGELNR